jgi:hypothetical protein
VSSYSKESKEGEGGEGAIFSFEGSFDKTCGSFDSFVFFVSFE